MSIEVPLRKEIEEYQIKVFGQATPRMILWGAVAAVSVVITVFVTTMLQVPTSVSSWVFMFIGIPAMVIGFWKPKSGQTPESYAQDLIAHYFSQNTWSYRSESPFLIEDKKEEKSGLTKKELKAARARKECSSQAQ